MPSRLVNQHFLACWRELDPTASKSRGLLSLMRRHRHNLKPEQRVKLQAYLAAKPVLEVIYRFKQRLCYLLLKKHKTRKQCQRLIPRFLRMTADLNQAGLAPLVQLGATLRNWSEQIVAMWSRKVFTTKWRPSADKLLALGTLKTTDSEFRYYV